MDTFIATRCVVHKVEHLLGKPTAASELSRRLARVAASIVIVATTIHEHAISVSIGATLTTERALGEIEMNICSLEHVVVDLVEIRHRSDNMSSDVSLVVEGLETTPDTNVRLQLETGISIVLLVDIDPLLDLNHTGSVIDVEGDICRLRLDLANLSDECDLCHGGTVDFEVCTSVCLFGIEDLLDCDRAQGLILV